MFFNKQNPYSNDSFNNSNLHNFTIEKTHLEFLKNSAKKTDIL